MRTWLIFLILIFATGVYAADDEYLISPGGLCGRCVKISLVNRCAVRGIEFKIVGCCPIEAMITERSEGFFIKVNEVTGSVILVSISGDMIEPGVGPVMVLYFGDDCTRLSVTGIGVECY